jgi:hypothetical protein
MNCTLNLKKIEIMEGLKQPRQTHFMLLIIFFCVSCISDLAAQKQEVDVVYLKTGEIYRGNLQNHSDEKQIMLQTLCWNRMIFNATDVDHISREMVNVKSSRSHVPSSGYFNRTDMGVLIGTGNNEKNAIFSAQMVNGYKIDSRFYPGFGIGIEFYEQAVVPLFADMSYHFSRNVLSPFVRGSVGYSLPVEDPPETWGVSTNNNGGYMYALGLGTFIRLNGHNSLSISLVYRFQSLKSVITQDWSDEVMNLNKQYNRIAFRIGFVFE